MDIYYKENADNKQSTNKAPINKIIPFSSVDGPGNRTSIFLQGCNLDCKYCHNPETRYVCHHCGECVNHCPVGAIYQSQDLKYVIYDKSKCVDCDACINSCMHGSTPKIEWLDARETFERVKKQIPFISGVTVSGGECMLYPEFIKELFEYCKDAGLSTLIDSNGMELFQSYEALLSVTDGVMLDIKSFSKEESIRVTGFDNRNILLNAVYLSNVDKLEEIRTVVVEELLDADLIIRNIGGLLSSHLDVGKLRYKLIAFRANGVREEYRKYKTPTESAMCELKKIAEEVGFQDIIII